jgi:hypothetical protein
VRDDKNLKFTDWHPIGLLGGAIFISVATLFVAVIWGAGASPNLTWSGKLVLWVVRIGITAFMMIFYYGGLEMLFGSFSARIDLPNKVIKYRQRPPPISRRSAIPFASIKSVSIEPHRMGGPFTSSTGFGVFILADRKSFLFETRDQNEAKEVARSVAETLNKTVQSNIALAPT